MTPLDGPHGERLSTAEQVAAALRSEVLAGVYRPGTPMRESVLAPLLGVSRATMRAALQHLVRDGIVVYHLNRGTIVASVTPEDVRDIYAVRLVLELAAIDAVDSEADLSPLKAASKSNADAAKRNDVSASVDTDMLFHSEIVHLLGSPRLSGAHQEALAQLRIVFNLFDRSIGELTTQAREHSRIVRLIQADDRNRAAALLRSHLKNARNSVASFVSGRLPGAAESEGWPRSTHSRPYRPSPRPE
jgi:DNA-binding GntR family transcriptional regulator